MRLIILTCLAWLASVKGQVDPYVATELQECMDSPDTVAMVEPDERLLHCMEKFLWQPDKVNWADYNITPRDMDRINELLRSSVQNGRSKRDANSDTVFPGTGFRIRREFRRLRLRERRAFSRAVNRLKLNGQYDTFANLHSGIVTLSAHGGPNFFGWHRVYLATVEEALRQFNRRVSIPYWDSSLDFDMFNPADSIIWSSKFLGNGDGNVTTGPFKYWPTPHGPLFRNVGGASRLISKDVIANVMLRCRTRQISVPTAIPPVNLEFIHGGPHVWVGGLMSGINTAAHDPTFFMHHAFIDYIWEMFRNRQVFHCGVNPETDYPNATERHDEDRPMDGFPAYRNIDGYRNYWTDFWYRYESSPTCSSFRPFCGSPYLLCDAERNRCISKPRPRIVPTDVIRIPSFFAGLTFSGPPDDIRPTSSSRTGSITSEASDPRDPGFSLQIPLLPSVDFSTVDESAQNSKIVGNLTSNTVKAFIPIKISYKRAHPSVLNSSIQDTITSADLSAPLDSPYSDCRPHPDGITTVTIESNGINYMGVFSNSVEIDTRLSASTISTYIRINPPNNGKSQLMLSAFHECGLMCQPTCAIPGTFPVMYRPCTGILPVRKGDNAVIYGTSVEAAIDNWRRTGTQMKPGLGLDPKVVFHCSNADVTPWSQLPYALV